MINNVEILWERIKKEYAHAFEKARNAGFVTFAQRGARVILTAFGPIGSALAEFSDLILNPFFRALGSAAKEWQQGIYKIRTTASGITVLERPEIITPHKSISLPEKRLTIPTRELITPPRERLLIPNHRFREQLTPYGDNRQSFLRHQLLQNRVYPRTPVRNKRELRSVKDRYKVGAIYPDWLTQAVQAKQQTVGSDDTPATLTDFEKTIRDIQTDRLLRTRQIDRLIRKGK